MTWPVLVNIRASKHSLISYLCQQSKQCYETYLEEMHRCRCLSQTGASDFSDVYVLFSRFLLHICFVSNCRCHFYLCSALVVSAPVLFVPYCFLILCHFCFSSLPLFIQLLINGSIHAEFVVNKTFISVTPLSTVSQSPLSSTSTTFQWHSVSLLRFLTLSKPPLLFFSFFFLQFMERNIAL